MLVSLGIVEYTGVLRTFSAVATHSNGLPARVHVGRYSVLW
jgi:hypothetical protein